MSGERDFPYYITNEYLNDEAREICPGLCVREYGHRVKTPKFFIHNVGRVDNKRTIIMEKIPHSFKYYIRKILKDSSFRNFFLKDQEIKKVFQMANENRGKVVMIKDGRAQVIDDKESPSSEQEETNDGKESTSENEENENAEQSDSNNNSESDDYSTDEEESTRRSNRMLGNDYCEVYIIYEERVENSYTGGNYMKYFKFDLSYDPKYDELYFTRISFKLGEDWDVMGDVGWAILSAITTVVNFDRHEGFITDAKLQHLYSGIVKTFFLSDEINTIFERKTPIHKKAQIQQNLWNSLKLIEESTYDEYPVSYSF